MVLRLGQARGEDVADLIARKQYPKAIEIIKAQLGGQKSDPRIRLQLADVLVLANRPQEAVAVLVPLADEYARDGFAAKAVAVLKRIQKIDPRRRDIEARLASLIESKQRQATVPIAAAPARVEFGFEEIQPGLELGMEAFDDEPAPEPPAEVPAPAAAEPPPRRPDPAPVVDHDLAFGDSDGPALVLEPEPEVVIEADPVVEAEPVIFIDPDGSASPLGDDSFTQELMSIIDDVFPTAAEEPDPPPPDPSSAADGAAPAVPAHPRQIVVSPLFSDFSVDEMVAVIHGLKLICYEPGEIIIGEGEPGDSLYMISAGRVKAFKRNAAGRQTPLGEMSEGAFFGEISVLTGKPRSATVVAASACELLELDRPTLDGIGASHPHVWDVLREYAERRMKGS